MLTANQAMPTLTPRPAERGALPQDPNGKGRGNRGSPVWMQYADPSPRTLLPTPHRTPPGLPSHHRGTAQETRQSDDLVQPCPTRCEGIETTLPTRRLLWTRGVHPHERRTVANANRVWKPYGCSAVRTGWEGEIVDRLRTERRPVMLNSGGLESDGVGGRGAG